MTAIEYERSLRLAGFTPDQSEAIATGYVDKNELVTKEYLRAELKTLELSMITKLSAILVFALSPIYIKVFGG
jgi:hypothetical protein